MIKLEVYWDKATKKQGYSVIVDGKTVKEEIIKATSSDKKQGLLEELKRGILNTKGFVNHSDTLMIVLQDKLITRWFYTYKAEKKYQKYLSIMDEISDIIEELDCKYRFICLEDYLTKRKVPAGELSTVKTMNLAEAFSGM